MDGWREPDDDDRRRQQAEKAARAAERRQARAARMAKRRAHVTAWLDEQGLMPIAWAVLAGVTAILLFAVAAMLRIPCDPEGCPVFAGLPAGILETLALAILLAGLAAVGVWISRLTQRTWAERLRLQRAELDIGKKADAEARRRLDAILDDDGDVAAIHQQARLYFWAGLPVAIVSLLLTPYSLGTFGDVEFQAAYALPIVMLGLIAGIAACVRGLVLGAAGRRLTRPLRERNGSKSRGRKRAPDARTS